MTLDWHDYNFYVLSCLLTVPEHIASPLGLAKFPSEIINDLCHLQYEQPWAADHRYA